MKIEIAMLVTKLGAQVVKNQNFQKATKKEAKGFWKRPKKETKKEAKKRGSKKEACYAGWSKSSGCF